MISLIDDIDTPAYTLEYFKKIVTQEAEWLKTFDPGNKNPAAALREKILKYRNALIHTPDSPGFIPRSLYADPSEEQIEIRTAIIRQRWSQEVRMHRCGINMDYVPWSVPTYNQSSFYDTPDELNERHAVRHVFRIVDSITT